MNKILKKILVVVIIVLILWAIYITIDCIRLKNSEFNTHPLINLGESVDMESITYTGLGYTISYALNNDNFLEGEPDTGINDAEFKLFGLIPIWSYIL